MEHEHPQSILSDECIYSIAKHLPETEGELARICRNSSPYAISHAEIIINIVQSGRYISVNGSTYSKQSTPSKTPADLSELFSCTAWDKTPNSAPQEEEPVSCLIIILLF